MVCVLSDISVNKDKRTRYQWDVHCTEYLLNTCGGLRLFSKEGGRNRDDYCSGQEKLSVHRSA